MLILAQNAQNVKNNSHFSTFSEFLKINSHFRIFLSDMKSLISPNFRIFKYVAFVRMPIDKPLF